MVARRKPDASRGEQINKIQQRTPSDVYAGPAVLDGSTTARYSDMVVTGQKGAVLDTKANSIPGTTTIGTGDSFTDTPFVGVDGVVVVDIYGDSTTDGSLTGSIYMYGSALPGMFTMGTIPEGRPVNKTQSGYPFSVTVATNATETLTYGVGLGDPYSPVFYYPTGYGYPTPSTMRYRGTFWQTGTYGVSATLGIGSGSVSSAKLSLRADGRYVSFR